MKRLSIYAGPVFVLLMLGLRYAAEIKLISQTLQADLMYVLFALPVLVLALRKPGELFKPDLLCAAAAFFIATSIAVTEFISEEKAALLSGAGEYLGFLQSFVFCYLLFAAVKLLGLGLYRPDSSGVLGRKKMGLKESLLFVALMALILGLHYQRYFPYGTSPDTLNQWDQIHGLLNYNKIHAIGHTIFLKALLSVYDSYTIVILCHLLLVVLVYLLFARWFRQKGFSAPVLLTVFGIGLIAVAACSDAFYYAWKDTPAAICLCIVTLLLMKYHDEGQLSLPMSLLLGLALGWCWLFRLNGIIALFVCGGYFALSFIARKYYRQLALMLAAIALSVSFVNVYSARVLKPTEYNNGFAIQPFLYGIAAMVDSGELTEQELEEIDALISVEWMQESYSRFSFRNKLIWMGDGDPRITADANMAVFNSGFVLDAGEHRAEIIKLYLRLMPRHITTCVKDVFASLYMMWQCKTLLIDNYLFWFLLIAFMAIKAGLKLKDSIIFLPSLCNTVSIMISTITNEKRYLLPFFMLVPVFFLYILWKNSEYKNLN